MGWRARKKYEYPNRLILRSADSKKRNASRILNSEMPRQEFSGRYPIEASLLGFSLVRLPRLVS